MQLLIEFFYRILEVTRCEIVTSGLHLQATILHFTSRAPDKARLQVQNLTNATSITHLQLDEKRPVMPEASAYRDQCI